MPIWLRAEGVSSVVREESISIKAREILPAERDILRISGARDIKDQAKLEGRKFKAEDRL
jgi:hypothetical protein